MPIFSRYSLVTLIRSLIRAFQWAYNKRCTSSLSAAGGGGAWKRKTVVFRVKLHFTWRKSATKFLCVNTVSDKVITHLLAYIVVSIRAKIVRMGRPLLRENLLLTVVDDKPTPCFRKKHPLILLAIKLRNSCLILIIFDSKIPHIIWHRKTA